MQPLFWCQREVLKQHEWSPCIYEASTSPQVIAGTIPSPTWTTRRRRGCARSTSTTPTIRPGGDKYRCHFEFHKEKYQHTHMIFFDILHPKCLHYRGLVV